MNNYIIIIHNIMNNYIIIIHNIMLYNVLESTRHGW